MSMGRGHHGAYRRHRSNGPCAPISQETRDWFDREDKRREEEEKNKGKYDDLKVTLVQLSSILILPAIAGFILLILWLCGYQFGK